MSGHPDGFVWSRACWLQYTLALNDSSTSGQNHSQMADFSDVNFRVEMGVYP